MHDFHDPTVFFEEVQAWRFLRQFVLWVVLQHFIDLEPQRQHDFFLLAELQVLPFILKLQFFVSLVNPIQLFNE